MARKTQEETDKTRARILAAAEEVFAKRGFEGAAMSDIAKRAKVAKSLIHHHYDSKQALWDAVRLSSFSRYAVEQLATLSTDGAGQPFVRKSLTAYFRFLQASPGFVRMLHWSQAERGASFDKARSSATAALAKRLVDEGAERVRELQRQGEIRADLDARLLIACFLALLREWFVVREDYFGGATEARAVDDEYLHTVISVFWSGIRP
jgi:TetR/AcrR family transcriptional regulator